MSEAQCKTIWDILAAVFRNNWWVEDIGGYP